MRLLRYLLAILLPGFLLLTATIPLAASAKRDGVDAKATLVIGKVSLNMKKHRRQFQPMADYLAHNMADLGITSGAVLLADSNQQLIDYLKEGKLDLVLETPFSAMIYTQSAPAEAIARMWKRRDTQLLFSDLFPQG